MFYKLVPLITIALCTYCDDGHAKKISMAEVENSNFEFVINDASQVLREVGKAKFSFFIWDVYESKLLTDSGKYKRDLQQNIRYEITYLRDISSEELIKRTVEQWQHLGLEQQLYVAYLPALAESWPDIKAGDRLTLLVKDYKSAFYHNFKLTNVIDSQHFAPLFLDIWLSKYTSQPKLRSALLGGENG